VAGETVPPPDGLAEVVSKYAVLNVAVYVVMAEEAVTEWLSAPPSDQLTNVSCVPADGVCGVVVAMVCCDPACQLTLTGEACDFPPSTLTSKPDGEVLIVTLELLVAKFAVTVSGPLIVTVVEASVLVPAATGPVQLVNL
jgi:hypothetical protein